MCAILLSPENKNIMTCKKLCFWHFSSSQLKLFYYKLKERKESIQQFHYSQGSSEIRCFFKMSILLPILSHVNQTVFQNWINSGHNAISKAVVFLLQRGMYTDKRKCTWRIELNLHTKRREKMPCALKIASEKASCENWRVPI